MNKNLVLIFITILIIKVIHSLQMLKEETLKFKMKPISKCWNEMNTL